jgi:parallel beta-helix repeat protein
MIGNVSGNTFYVNTTGDGGAFTSIQDAINASSDGDMVYVYSGTYYENLIIDKTISLKGESKDNTIVNGSIGDVVIFIGANWVNVTGFSIKGNYTSTGRLGIKLYYTLNCSISNNVISNSLYGIYLDYSHANHILENDFKFTNTCVHLESSDKNHINENNVSSQGRHGIRVLRSNDNIILKNNCSYLEYQALSIIYSDRNSIINNTLINNEYGLSISHSNNNLIELNKLFYNDYGIYLYSSKMNSFKSNILMEDGFLLGGLGVDYWNSHSIDISNIVNGKPVYFYKDQDGITVPTGSGQIILANCTNFEIKDQTFNKTTAGIQIGHSTHNNITNNSLYQNLYGIIILYSQWNNISFNNITANYYGCTLSWRWNLAYGNWISNNYYGIRISGENNVTRNNLSNNEYGISGYCAIGCNINQNNIISNRYMGIFFHDSWNNRIYHNSFIDNANRPISNGGQFWDDGYPLGGNYWSYYNGSDYYKGPNQDQPGSDDIGDTKYEVLGYQWDNYPLMEPYTHKPLENYTILKQSWNLISIPLIQQIQNLQKVLEMIDGYYDAVQWFKPNDLNDPWKHHKVGKPYRNDLFKLNETMGFWIHITNPGDTIFLYNGTQPSVNQTIQLNEGWNMVGYPSLTNYNRTGGLNNLTFNDQVDAIWTYDAYTQKWNELGESDIFEVGKGYYIHAKTKCEWEVPL